MATPDFTKLSPWIEANVSGLRAPLAFELIAGGRSNLTYRIIDADGRTAVLRRPPTSHVLPTAHDMKREFRIISALYPTLVPVARPLALCEDNSIVDLPQYVMSFVDGYILKDKASIEASFDKETRGRISRDLVDVLADLHSLDVDTIGLGELGRHDGYVERQLKRWYAQYRSSASEINHFVEAVDRVHDELRLRIPRQMKVSVVHGDYRLDNTMISPEGTVAAVLDWEICTLGDPLADLGLLIVYWADRGDDRPSLTDATTLDGFWDREQIMKHYAQRTGADLSQIPYYVAFAYWKLACILEGVYSRYVQGATGGDQSDVTSMSGQVEWLASSALEWLTKV